MSSGLVSHPVASLGEEVEQLLETVQALGDRVGILGNAGNDNVLLVCGDARSVEDEAEVEPGDRGLAALVLPTPLRH